MGNNKARRNKICFTICIMLHCVLTFVISAQTSVFTYQGRLNDGGIPANGSYDMQFKLFDDSTAGNQIGTTLTVINVQAVAGIFSTSLDFGAAAFFGADRFLEISISPAGQNTYASLSPRQRITGAPYSILSANSVSLGGIAANQYVLTNDPRLDANNYVQNSTALQPNVRFSIGGTGTANIFNATVQFDLGGNRILSNAGTENLFAGVNSGLNNSTGAANSFFGSSAGLNNTIGAGNTFFGRNAGSQNFNGNNNTFIGNNADFLLGLPVGINNTLLGAFTQIGAGVNFSTAIGEGAQVTQSNSVILGRTNVRVGIGTSAPLAKLHIKGAEEGIIIQGQGQAAPNLAYLSFTDATNTQIGYVGDGSVGDKNVFLTSLGGDVELATAAGRILTASSEGNILMKGGPSVLGPSLNTYAAQTIDTGNFKGIYTPNLFLSSLDTFAASPIHLCARLQTIGAGTGGYALTRCSTPFSADIERTDTKPFRRGLDAVKRLNPISFKWKYDGNEDIGLNVKEVADIEPQIVSFNAQGAAEHIKESSLNLLLINAVKEQQIQIEAQQKQIDELKKLVCAMNPNAKVCRKNK